MRHLLFLVILGFLLQSVGYSQGRPPCFPRGVANPTKTIGYAAQENSTIVALSLQGGKVAWTSSDATFPLMVVAKQLMAADYSQAKSGQFTVVILDAFSGKLLARSEAISFGQSAGYEPEGLPAVEATLVDGKIRVTWAVNSRYRGGAAPPIQRANIIPRERMRSVTVDPATAQITQQSEERTTPFGVPRGTGGEALEYIRGSEWTKGSWFAGDSLVDLVEVSRDGQSQLELRIMDRVGQKIKRIVPVGSTDLISQLQVTTDGAYVVIPDEKNRGGIWRILRANTGAEIGRATLEADPREICVLEPQLYYLVGSSPGKSSAIMLRAVDVRANREVWEYSLGEPRTGRPPRLPQ